MAITNSTATKNIKRRVYDSLNVLKAAEVITKHGKMIRWNDVIQIPRMSNVYDQRSRMRLKHDIDD